MVSAALRLVAAHAVSGAQAPHGAVVPHAGVAQTDDTLTHAGEECALTLRLLLDALEGAGASRVAEEVYRLRTALGVEVSVGAR
eukprot:6203156-Pleurochrysis_carterae.AAC.1